MTLTIRPLAETFAAEVRGVDLRAPHDPVVIQEIYQAWLDHGVLVIPGQALSIDEHLRFARTFGDLWSLPSWARKGRIDNAQIDDVSNLTDDGDLAGSESDRVKFQLGNLLWHSDSSSAQTPAKASMLHALEIVPVDGETEFADPRGAYEALPPEMKARLDGLVAQFSFAYAREKTGYAGEKLAFVDKIPTPHPLVRVHPETGRKNLFIGQSVVGIDGMADDAAKALIEELNDFVTQPRFVYRHRWAVNDLVIWDNRRTLHRARRFDADRFRRVMHRATVNCEEPTMVDGRIAIPQIGLRGPYLETASAAPVH